MSKSTLSGMRPDLNRRSGNTTRLIDNAIQIIYSGEECLVMDHHELGTHRQANRNLLQRIVTRLRIEHAGDMLSGRILVDEDRMTIILKR